MKLTQEQKDEIRELARAYVNRFPSQAKAATSLKGIISTGTLSTLLNGKYEAISDEMFLRLRAQVSVRSSAEWQICQTQMYCELMTLLEDAQEYQNVAWAIAPAGSGKTTAARLYVAQRENAFLVSCSEDMRRGDFIREMARTVGIDVGDMSLRMALDKTIKYLQTLDQPLLIFDEGDKLSDAVLYYFITIYNALEGHCGLFFISTHYIRRRMEIGLAYNKKGYDEIHSRICRKFVELTPTSEFDVAAVARANGIADERTLRTVVKDAISCRCDLRRVRREVHKQKRIAGIV
ncbi:ATP-binding protein [uncultured Alistipes sp.]|uniref:ATP-binding protein n=1 Tax=uncultured Alistipes sp. TaxID=538949 RepID=UPI0025F2B882|nr:ATP-binding protein [uncultured Alistipes sp.]